MGQTSCKACLPLRAAVILLAAELCNARYPHAAFNLSIPSVSARPEPLLAQGLVPRDGPLSTVTTSTVVTKTDTVHSMTEVLVITGMPVVSPQRFRLFSRVLGGRLDMDNLYVHGPLDEDLEDRAHAMPRMEAGAEHAAQFFVDNTFGTIGVLCHAAPNLVNPNSTRIVVDQHVDGDGATTGVELVLLGGGNKYTPGQRGAVLYANDTGTPRLELVGAPFMDELLYLNDRFGGWLACYSQEMEDKQYNPHGRVKAVLLWWDLQSEEEYDRRQCARVELVPEWIDGSKELCHG